VSRPQADSLALRPVPRAIASITQLAEPGGDVRQAAEDPPHRLRPVRARSRGRRMQSERFLRLPNQRGKVVFVVDVKASLLQHGLGGALDELLRRANGKGRVRVSNTPDYHHSAGRRPDANRRNALGAPPTEQACLKNPQELAAQDGCRAARPLHAKRDWDHEDRIRWQVVSGCPTGPRAVPVHEASGLNGNIRDICGRFAAGGDAALGVDLFEGRNRAVCMARMFVGGMARNLDYYGVPALKAALGQLASRSEVDGARIGAIGALVRTVRPGAK
jgi:hypothetical protein